MNDLEILKGVRELLAEPEHWTQGVLARDATGQECDSRSERAHSWCLIGAAHHLDVPAKPIYNHITGSVIAFNDAHTHAEVLAKLDEAIAIETARAALALGRTSSEPPKVDEVAL